MLKQLRVARVRVVEPQNIDIFFCKVDPAWLLEEWNRKSATCRAACPRAFMGQSFPCPAVGDRRGKEMVLVYSFRGESFPCPPGSRETLKIVLLRSSWCRRQAAAAGRRRPGRRQLKLAYL